MDSPTIEWTALTDKLVAISDVTTDFWFINPEQLGDFNPFASPMTGSGSPGSTAGLLNGAKSSGLQGNTNALRLYTDSLPKYALHLVASYHNARRTVGNYLKAAKRFRSLGRDDIADYLERHAREENGHERLAVRDLKALHLPAERILANLLPDSVAALCDLFDTMSESDYPIGCIGYSYFFESSAATRQKEEIDALQSLCPEGLDGTRFMRAHSSMGSEADHVHDMITFIAGLPAEDRILIVQAVYTTARTVRNGLDGGGPNSDSEVWALIEAAAGDELGLPA